VAHLLREPYNDLLRRLPRQKSVRADETGHPENKRRLWTWCFRAKRYTLFHVAESRGADVLFDVLGSDFAGVLSCDYYSAYRKYMVTVHRAEPMLTKGFRGIWSRKVSHK
jgi:transposase